MALVATLSLVLTPLLVAPATASTEPPAEPEVSAEPTVEPSVEPTTEPTAAAVDVVAPAAELLAVTGAARVGAELAVDPQPELWAPADVALTFTYRWFADGAEIEGAHDGSLVLAAATVGRAVSVEITGAAPDDTVDGAASASVVVPVPDVVAPGTFTTRDLRITGEPRVGRTLTAMAGAWDPAVEPSFEWRRGDRVVGTKSTYTPVADDVSRVLTVVVSGKAEGYEPASVTATTGPVASGTLTAPTPTLSGTVRVGSNVTAKPGTWSSGTALTYRWYASGKAISGATKAAYTPTPSVKGRTLTVKVTGKKSGYTATTRSSAGKKVATGVLAAPKPTIKGTVRVGNTVSVTRGTWRPAASAYRYQWRVNGVAIKGATSSKYKIPSKYAGKKLTVTVRGSRSGYTTRTVTSSSSTVLRVYSKTSAPKISGSARVGSTLKVSSRGTWSPKPSSWRYQWRADGVAIKGATSSSFKITGAQYGKRITVTVKGVRAGYYSSSRTSARTARVTVPAPVLTKNGVYKVGTQIKPGTYVAPGSSAGCTVKRLDGSKKMVWAGLTYGRTIVTIRSTDKYFSTSGCGTWRKDAAYGKVRTSTAIDGIYKVGTSGGQLKPGLYYTSGPAYSDDICYVSALNSFAMTSAAIDEAAEFTEPGYWKVLPGDVGFEAYGCSWRRVSS